MTQEDSKKAIGYLAAEFVKEGMTVGLGTGSTARNFIERLIQRVKEGLTIRVVASSTRSWDQAQKGNLSLVDINTIHSIDLTVDGADEIDPEKRMIKGAGGALLREKIVASMSKEMVVVVDETKLVPHLGKNRLPVEVVPFACLVTLHKIQKLGYKGAFRVKQDGSYYVTDNGHYIVDITFSHPLKSPEEDHSQLKNIPGVVETGFFFHLAGRVVVGFLDGQVIVRP